ncbi:Hypothetical predicted protein [Pelobates cultripes]|uniref:Uncharacterized protein n=1 Tax=Pelobates cultripes TaxID=61616 RepID=A0AAD1SV14_PELCU|nr:Hypothetical predicted protein [Pelobates cultripes]
MAAAISANNGGRSAPHTQTGGRRYRIKMSGPLLTQRPVENGDPTAGGDARERAVARAQLSSAAASLALQTVASTRQRIGLAPVHASFPQPALIGWEVSQMLVRQFDVSQRWELRGSTDSQLAAIH